MIDESLKKLIEAEPISVIKIIKQEDEGLLKRSRSRQVSQSSTSEDKAQNLLGRSDEITSEVLKMLPAKVQSAIKVYHNYWIDNFSSYAETCDTVDMVEAGLHT